MRVVLFTGKGGVGKTTTAAGTAALAAAAGQRTLVMSTDAAHSLGDVFATALGPDPIEIGPRLHAQQVDAQGLLERSWVEVQSYLRLLLDLAGVDPIAAEELTIVPMAEEVLALLELRNQASSGNWDVVILDCAPTAETLRLLALPEVLGWYLDRLSTVRGRLLRTVAPVVTRATGVPQPSEQLMTAVARLQVDLTDVHSLLTTPSCSIRLVLTPEKLVVAEARRALTTLSLFGFRVDGVIVNRIFPTTGGAVTDDPWRAGWIAAQADRIAEVETSFAGIGIWRLPYQTSEPIGHAALLAAAEELYGTDDPVGERIDGSPLTIETVPDGAVLSLALPFASRADVDLARHGNELVITVGHYRRVLALPGGLAPMRVNGARIDGGSLRVRFAK